MLLVGSGFGESICCNLDDPNVLLQCVIGRFESHNSQIQELGVEDKGALVSFYTADIINYAAYAYALNALWAKEQNLQLRLLSDNTGHNFETRDPRWNRVEIMRRGLEEESLSFIVWVDADLVALDPKLSPAQLLMSHPQADILISAERHAETGVANTGCMIVRNTVWSKHFLKDWWYGHTRYNGEVNTNIDENFTHHIIAHDQYYFDRLYRSLSISDQSHIFILPTEALNSVPPAHLHQSSNHQVLHLMGQANELRAETFKLGYKNACQYHNNDSKESYGHRSQYGLSRHVLADLALKSQQKRLVQAVKLLSPSHNIIAEWQAAASEARELLLQLAQASTYNGDDNNINHTSTVAAHINHDVLRWILQKTIQSLKEVDSHVNKKNIIQMKVDLLNMCATVGHDLLQVIVTRSNKHTTTDYSQYADKDMTIIISLISQWQPQSWENWRLVHAQTLQCLQHLSVSVSGHRQSTQTVTEMMSILLQTTGQQEIIENNFENAINLYLQAICILKQQYFHHNSDIININDWSEKHECRLSFPQLTAQLVRAVRTVPADQSIPNLAHLVKPLSHLGTLLCKVRSNSRTLVEVDDTGNKNLSKSLGDIQIQNAYKYHHEAALLQRILLEMETQAKNDHLILIQVLIQHAYCHFNDDNSDKTHAQQILLEALSVCNKPFSAISEKKMANEYKLEINELLKLIPLEQERIKTQRKTLNKVYRRRKSAKGQ